MHGITQAQLRKIYALSRERGIDSETLHAHVNALTKKASLKSLTIAEAVKVIDSLEGKAATTPGMMTAAQERYIMGMMKDMGWTDENGLPDMNRLQGFVRERFKVEHVKWLTSSKASQVIEAFKAMKARGADEARAV